MSSERPRGLLLVVSSPSGAGKTTLCNRLRQEFPKIGFSVSYTTRAPRAGETDRVDIILILLPGVDQAQLCYQRIENLRGRLPDIALMLIAPHECVHLIEKALRLGADDYLTKPVNVDELLRTINVLAMMKKSK